MTSFEPDQVLLGRYRIERTLGSGGMGIVLRAVHVDLDTHVAIKILHGEVAQNPEAASRFLREAQAASKLRSEFVARVTDFGRLADGQPFMVMELLEGEDFEAILRRGPLATTDAVDAVLHAAAALAEAHAAGIVHRDIKPSNLFRTERPDGSSCVKVLDFGISKVIDPLGDRGLTQTGRALGTPLYMSPEQLRSPKDVDARTDVWSLGVVLHEMLAGEPPFLADQIGELVVRILEGAPAALEASRDDVPAALGAIVRSCLEKDRTKRVAGMRELAELLAPYASSEGGLAVRRTSIVGQPRTSATPSASGGPRPAMVAAALGAAATLDASALDLGGAEPVARSRPEPALEASARSALHSAITDDTHSRSLVVPPPPAPARPLARWALLAGAAIVVGGLGLALAPRLRGEPTPAAGVDAARPPPREHPISTGAASAPSSDPTVSPASSGLPLAPASASAAAIASAAPHAPLAATGAPRPRSTANAAPTPITPRPSTTTLW
jgi:serine/threonine-protein kinase